MFTLRKISSEGVEMNFVLGTSYTVIHKEHNKEEFLKHYKLTKCDDERIFCFIIGDTEHPLYENQHNYVMMQGATVCSYSYK